MASIVSIIPIVLLFILMLGFKMAGHKSALLTLVITVLLALFAASPLGMIAPEHAEDSVIALTGWAVVEGILKAVFPILIIILMAIYSYNILVESKQIEVIKRQFTSITDDKDCSCCSSYGDSADCSKVWRASERRWRYLLPSSSDSDSNRCSRLWYP